MDGWHVDDGSSGSSSSTAGSSLPKGTLLGHAYGVSFGSADHSSCTNSAIAFKEEEDYYLQQQLCQVYMDLDMEPLFSEEFVVGDSQSAELLFPAAEQWQPSSSTSSSPRRSLSTSCSPDNSTSLHLNNMRSNNPSTTLTIPSAQQVTRPTSTFAAQPPHQSTSRPAYDKRREVRFPASASEDMAITSAMLAILSSSSSSSSTTQAASNNKQYSFQPSRPTDQFRSGFRPYSCSALEPVYEPKKKSCSQKMIKNSISILRRIDLMRDGSGTTTKGGSLPSNNQLHHVISERKRREKLNGSFHTLRMLLPPGSKKDKASVLHKTKDYLKTLKVQILELEKKNQMLEKHLSPLDEDDDDDTKEEIIDDGGNGGSVGRVCVRITEAFQHVRGVERISLKITVAAGRCDLIELALCVLECLKRMSVLSLLSMDAKNCTKHRSLDPFTWIKFKFEIKASDWDEVTFKEVVAGAVDVMTVEEIHDNPLVGVGVP